MMIGAMGDFFNLASDIPLQKSENAPEISLFSLLIFTLFTF